MLPIKAQRPVRCLGNDLAGWFRCGGLLGTLPGRRPEASPPAFARPPPAAGASPGGRAPESRRGRHQPLRVPAGPEGGGRRGPLARLGGHESAPHARPAPRSSREAPHLGPRSAAGLGSCGPRTWPRPAGTTAPTMPRGESLLLLLLPPSRELHTGSSATLPLPGGPREGAGRRRGGEVFTRLAVGAR